MPVVDELITRYKVDDKDYRRGSKRIEVSAREVGRAIGASVATVGAAAIGFAAVSMRAAAQFDTMTRKFAGAFGSIESAKSMMSDLELYATRSAFSLEALADAATQLAVAGLDVKRFLPLVERFALVVSGVDPQGLKQVAGALMRAKGGSFGEAMEVFRRAGIGSPELMAQGLTVTKGGEIKATSGEFFNALERASEPLKRIADAVTGGAENTFSNVGDAMGRAVRVFGSALNDALLPKIKDFVDQVSKLVDDGKIGILASQFTLVADSLTGSGGMADAVDTVALGLFQIGRWAEMFIQTMRQVGKWDIPKMLTGPIGGLWIDPLRNALSGFFENTKQEFEAGLPVRDMAKKAAEDAAPGQGEAPTLEALQTVGLLGKIEEHTREAVELQRIALGGGALASAGISAVRVNAMSGRGADQAGSALVVGMFLASLRRGPGVSRR